MASADGRQEPQETTVTSPYVRRLRLAAELRRLREEADLTTDQLAKLVFQSRTKISKLENAQIRPDLAEIVTLLNVLGVTGRSYDRVFALAHAAALKGWWDKYGNAMGARQRLYADLESGAASVRSYNQTAFPAILQLPEFVAAMVKLDRCQGPLDYRPERMAEARDRRRRHLLSPDGPTYEAVLDESMIHRLAVPPAVKAAQLRHLIEVVAAGERVTMRVLPGDVPLPGGFLPKASFFLYDFPDPADPGLAVVDTVTTDLVLTGRREVERYAETYDRLRTAALCVEDSLSLLDRVSRRLAEPTESDT